MITDFQMQKKEGFLHFTVTGKRNLDSIKEAATRIIQSASQQQIERVLVDIREFLRESAPSALDTYELGSDLLPSLNKRLLRAAAIVDIEENMESLRFFENVAVNRGYNVKVCTDMDEATKWLTA